ncbi:proline-specific permease [Durotheca rogersii]|uniref:proline-specific permease n=1 Tax=Durotheca rogersii TaxID=419775 RepID=UPI00221E7202|nr:proline-specific permease [Durotheca rogersii]KAI5859805.1 proline-specific permease [Durotheca rogersii]
MTGHASGEGGVAYATDEAARGDVEVKNLERPKSSRVGEMNLESTHQLKRGLKSRHIQFLALGGAIGTGLFIGSGQILASTGPAPLFMAYLSMMLVVWVVMNDLAEMVTYLPMKGISIPYFVGRFLDPSIAFASGWNYWYAYAILVAAECTAGGLILQYWTRSVHVAVWIAIQLVVILLLNVIAVSFFGEAEFWFASIKLITILGLIILGIVLFFGGGPNHDPLYFRYWQDPPGAFRSYPEGVFASDHDSTGRFLAYWSAFIRAGFSFITSPELIALSAGETVAPRRNIPKAARRFVWRLAVFYGLGSLVIGVVVPWNDERLVGEGAGQDASTSPYVIGIARAGIRGLDHVINAAVLTSAWSAGNAFCYSGSRVLYSMAATGQAPRCFARTTRRGVPWVAVLATLLVGCLAFLNASSPGAQVFRWFTNLSTISGFIAWLAIMATYLRFRRALGRHGLLQGLAFRGAAQPWATVVALTVVAVLTVTNGFDVFFPTRWSAANFLAAYITIPIFLALYATHKLLVGRRAGWRLAIPIEDVDVWTGKREMDELCALDREPVPRNWVEKAWYWLA